ncbi:MAG: diacylglycerol kinase family protein [Bacteroidota bacterium]
MDKKEWVFIVNPIAGNGFGEKYLPVIKEKIAQYGIQADIELTEYHGHASELAKKYADNNYQYIIGVGGDGTINEICLPLVGNKNVITGIIPAGTGNDFIQILGLPNRFTDADWDIFFKIHTIPMDVGSVNGMYFINGMGLGFDAQVAAENYIEPGQVKRGGPSKYIWQIIKTLLFYREKKVIMKSNGNTYETSCFMNTIAIGRRFAASFFLTPKAVANDGLLDVCSIKKLNLFERFQLLLMVPKGTHVNDPRVHYYQTDHVNLEFTTEVPFHVDGEIHFAKSFEVSLLPEALRMIYNPNGPHYFKVKSDE